MLSDQYLVRQNITDGSVRLNLSFIKNNDPIAQLDHELKIVRRDDLSTWEFSKHVDQRTASPRIQICRRLVEYQNFRITRQDTC